MPDAVFQIALAAAGEVQALVEPLQPFLRGQLDRLIRPEPFAFADRGIHQLAAETAPAMTLRHGHAADEGQAPGGMLLIVAQECREHPRVWDYVQELIAADNPISGVQVFDLRQSMRNGGGPACLRLRVALNGAERDAVNESCWLTPGKHAQLVNWVEAHYRDRMQVADLADPQLLEESRTALDQLTQLLRLGSVYDFQRV